MNIPGGWSPSTRPDNQSIQAANSVVHELSRTTGTQTHLVSIDSIQKQVVNGMNYHMVLTVRSNCGMNRQVNASVYVPIRGKPQVQDISYVSSNNIHI